MKRLDLMLERLEMLKKYEPTSDEIPELEKKIKNSKRGRSSKRKGATYDSNIRKLLGERFPELDFSRVPSSGGFQKSSNNNLLRGDIVNLNEEFDFDLHLELKNQNRVQIHTWYKQAESDCVDGKIPIVIMHRPQENLEGKRITKADDFVFLKLSDFLKIVDDKKIIKKSIDKS